MTIIQHLLRSLVCISAAVIVGCNRGPDMGELSGTVQVDGQTPAAGSSITFIPMDGKSPTAGAVIESGRYSAQVPVGAAKVEIRVPRPRAGGVGNIAGPGAGPGGGGLIEESLPAKYNDQSELKLDVTRGKFVRDWELSTK